MPGHLVVLSLHSPARLLISDLISEFPGPIVNRAHLLPAVFPPVLLVISRCHLAPYLYELWATDATHLLLSAHRLLERSLWILDAILASCQDHLPATCSPLPGTDSLLLC